MTHQSISEFLENHNPETPVEVTLGRHHGHGFSGTIVGKPMEVRFSKQTGCFCLHLEARTTNKRGRNKVVPMRIRVPNIASIA